ncbi:hypothetical protein K435DRAFT_781176 [Dendrothele bispora CBS 962.96]|uniref:Uncharacterized protein n=1 Tax=Dendrothele bispora (strain CBS 962.96) TaxID=1314807 RepID=A0A4S8LMN9_DENBC|nr:hypothetical protein K435DRAFT_781176 [Dendrothele bispora CBS 962.96]
MHRGSLSVLCLSIFFHLEYAVAECGPQQALYYDPEETRSPRCCQEGGTVTWQDQAAKIGFCCAPGHEWTGDISSGEGGCCPIGMLMIEGMCVDGDSPEAQKAKSKSEGGSGCGCHHHPSNDGGEEPLMPATHGHAEISDEEEMDFENNGIVDMKIRYGQCYRLVTVPSGKEIGSNRENTIYTPGGLFQGIPFRVCRSTRDCSGGNDPEADVVLSSKSLFYLQDQMGRYNDLVQLPVGSLPSLAVF